MSVRLPLVSATFTMGAPVEHSRDGGPSSARSLSRGMWGLHGVPLQRAAFYAGAVALAALEVVEWPVTLLVVAGTYAVDRAHRDAEPPVVASSAPGTHPTAP